MKQLGTLIRLQKRDLDEQRQKLAQLESRRDHYIEQIAELSEALTKEHALAQDLPDMRGFFGDYSGAIKKRQQQIAAQVVKVETQIQHAKLKISAQFAELKKFEIVRDRRLAREREEARRLEQLAMDEIGIRNAIFFTD